MLSLLFFLYLITGIQIFINKDYKFFRTQIVCQFLLMMVLSVIDLVHHMSDKLALCL